MQLQELTDFFDRYAPPAFQEDFDNSGLLVGEASSEVKKVLVTLDCTEEVVDEAIEKGANVIIAHHPLIFAPLKALTGKDHVQRTVMKALRHKVAIYAAHTNLDKVGHGVNARFADSLGLKEQEILSPIEGHLLKLAVFTPSSHADKLRDALFESGAGAIGDYSECAFETEGSGSFKPGSGTDPYVGEEGKRHEEEEVRIETILPAHLKGKVIRAMMEAHPYEEVAYDLYRLENKDERNGLGMIGELEEAMEEKAFLKMLKERMKVDRIRHSPLLGQKVKRVAICGGSGSSLRHKAITAGADAYVTADVKYHEFFDADGRILFADIGHYESEQYSVELLKEAMQAEFPKFAILASELNTNPVNHF